MRRYDLKPATVGAQVRRVAKMANKCRTLLYQVMTELSQSIPSQLMPGKPKEHMWAKLRVRITGYWLFTEGISRPRRRKP